MHGEMSVSVEQRRDPELRELLENPEQVFDSDLERAERQHEEVMHQLIRIGEVSRERWRREGRVEFVTRAEVGGSRPTIEVFWAKGRWKKGMMLRLAPIQEGIGTEAGVLAYEGLYGMAEEKEGKPCFVDEEDPRKTVTLERLFAVPKKAKLLVKPTATLWGIGQDELVAIFGRDTYTLYIGLGFLFLGHQWMHVGMHEGGHISSKANSVFQDDENMAWTRANRVYARISKPIKDKIAAGKTSGLFDLARRPDYGDDLTIGKIVQYGLVSHARKGNASISKNWQNKSKRILVEFKNAIASAQDAYDHMLK